MRSPAVVEELANFENDMMLLVKNIQFGNISDSFQGKLKRDIEEIRKSRKILVLADKSRNIYIMDKGEYKKVSRKNFHQNL